VRGRRPADQEKLLLEASESYGAALAICRSAHAVLYNWGVALTDLARLAKMSGSPEHRNFLNAAGEKYAAALRWNPRNPEALNNLGLVLQDLAQGLAPHRHRDVMGFAAAKFRRALRQRPDFHRAAYNLGTVYYANAAALGHHQWPSARDGPLQVKCEALPSHPAGGPRPR
jgi:tetratricopeptide (TPR) repeat protein